MNPTLLRKLKFYIIGLIPGFLLVFFILNKKGASCSGYLPNSRVIAETLSKDFLFAPEFQKEMQTVNINEKILRDSLISKGEIDFTRSQTRKNPCPTYILTSSFNKTKYEIGYEKCKENVTFTSLKKIN